MTVVRELGPADAPALTALYDEYDWWADRETEEIQTALAGTDIALGVEQAGTLVAAARVLTDFRYYGVVFDVIVASDRRGDGVGERLMSAIVDHPRLRKLPGLSLQCRRGLVPFYESVGFEVFDDPVDVPGGGEEELCRMVYRRERDGSSA